MDYYAKYQKYKSKLNELRAGGQEDSPIPCYRSKLNNSSVKCNAEGTCDDKAKGCPWSGVSPGKCVIDVEGKRKFSGQYQQTNTDPYNLPDTQALQTYRKWVAENPRLKEDKSIYTKLVIGQRSSYIKEQDPEKKWTILFDHHQMPVKEYFNSPDYYNSDYQDYNNSPLLVPGKYLPDKTIVKGYCK